MTCSHVGCTILRGDHSRVVVRGGGFRGTLLREGLFPWGFYTRVLVLAVGDRPSSFVICFTDKCDVARRHAHAVIHARSS